MLIHGFGPTAGLCEPLAKRLESEGYGVVLFDYPSTATAIVTSASLLLEALDELDADPAVRRVHLVTHSMGGVLTRFALTQHRPAKLGRIVMIAPPNRGSPKADFFAPLFGWLFKPLADLETGESSAVNRLPPLSGVDIGVLAGDADWTVPPSFTLLEGAADFLVLDNGFFATTHNGLMLGNDETPRQVLYFLDHGHFEHSAPSSAD